MKIWRAIQDTWKDFWFIRNWPSNYVVGRPANGVWTFNLRRVYDMIILLAMLALMFHAIYRT